MFQYILQDDIVGFKATAAHPQIPFNANQDNINR